jgi:hypothetical protein
MTQILADARNYPLSETSVMEASSNSLFSSDVVSNAFFCHIEGDVAMYTAATRLLSKFEAGIKKRAEKLCDDRLLDLVVLHYLVLFCHQEVAESLHLSSRDKNMAFLYKSAESRENRFVSKTFTTRALLHVCEREDLNSDRTPARRHFRRYSSWTK